MRLLRWFRDHPIVLFAVVLAGLGAWIASDMTNGPKPVVPDGPAGVDLVGPVSLTLPYSPPAAPTVTTVSLNKLPQLRPGMSRVAVENLIGAPLPEQLGPISVLDGRATYLTTYPLDLEAETPNTVRPARFHPPRPPAPENLPRAELVLTLEFDASRPGHPLVRVQYPTAAF